MIIFNKLVVLTAPIFEIVLIPIYLLLPNIQ